MRMKILLYSDIDYKKIQAPFLVVTGNNDSMTPSTDAFVEKAKVAGVNITYL